MPSIKYSIEPVLDTALFIKSAEGLLEKYAAGWDASMVTKDGIPAEITRNLSTIIKNTGEEVITKAEWKSFSKNADHRLHSAA